jgi:hypothetical protein
MRKVILGLSIALVAWGPAYRASAEGDDRAAAQEIAENMKQSGQLQDYRVGVKYQNGVAWLMGTVTSKQQKAAAERIARETPGVERVVSKLEVTGKNASENAGKVRQASAASGPQRAQRNPNSNMPVPYARTMQGQIQPTNYGEYCPPGGPGMGGYGGGGGMGYGGGGGMGPAPMGNVPAAVGQAVSYDNPQLPGYAWPSYAAYPNYAALTYPQQYSPSAWPYIGPFYPYPQVPLGWRKVTLEWDDGWWFLDFKDNH